MSDKPIKTTHAPLYANVYATLVPVARAHGYALAVHGSMARDLDLIAVPWMSECCSPAELVHEFSKAVAFNCYTGPTKANHGREIWTLTFPGDCFVDLSVMPMEPWNAKL
jgi:hypothetical protein